MRLALRLRLRRSDALDVFALDLGAYHARRDGVSVAISIYRDYLRFALQARDVHLVPDLDLTTDPPALFGHFGGRLSIQPRQLTFEPSRLEKRLFVALCDLLFDLVDQFVRLFGVVGQQFARMF